MNVLMHLRPNHQTVPGGDVVQLRETAAALERIGVTVNVASVMDADLASYDVVHLFNLCVPEFLGEPCFWARWRQKPVALSTIYWDTKEFADNVWRIRRGEIPQWGSANGTVSHEPPSSDSPYFRLRAARQRLVVAWSDVYLPNSEVEAEKLLEDFGVEREKIQVVPNAAAGKFLDAKPNGFAARHGMRGDFVLCAGRIEPRKNQLALIRALKPRRVPLALVGAEQDAEYARRCRQEAYPEVRFIGNVGQDALAAAYAEAKVHALPSWLETPGLASLEAALAGSNIVSTDRGCTREYFADLAWYCNPADLSSIQSAVLAALHHPRSEKLRQRVRERFTWEAAAAATLKAYEKALAGRQGGRLERSDELLSLWEYAKTLDELRERAEARADAVESRRLVRYVDGIAKRLSRR
jgi:glycosyltransferase involved in cell wall biosynthesis